MAEKTIIIIGAGLAGLSAGVYAQINGYRARIFEHHSQPGGVVASWKRGDYLIDGGFHFLMGHRPDAPTYALYRALGLTEGSRFLDMELYARFVDEESGISVDVIPDLDRLAGDLKALFPDDARTIGEIISGSRAMRDSGVGFEGMEKPQELMGLMERIRSFWGMRGVFKYFGGKFGKPVAEYARDARSPVLRRIIENLFYPEVPVWFLFMILGLLARRDMGLLEGGSLEFARLIEKRFKDLGGEITYKATVEKIVVENDRAVGIRLADGTEHRADVIVSAADGYSTIFEMLEGRYVSDEIRNRHENWPLVRPLLTASFGVAREFKDDPPFEITFFAAPIVVGEERIPGMWIRVFNYSGKFAPPGKTVVQATVETSWDYWNDLRRQKVRYDAEKDRLAAEILARLEVVYPGISAQVEVTDVTTPYTTWRYTLNRRGAYEGWIPTPKAIMSKPIRTLPGLAGFYMAGQWVVPGGGVPPCLYSGRHVIQILRHRAGKPFLTTTS